MGGEVLVALLNGNPTHYFNLAQQCLFKISTFTHRKEDYHHVFLSVSKMDLAGLYMQVEVYFLAQKGKSVLLYGADK